MKSRRNELIRACPKNVVDEVRACCRKGSAVGRAVLCAPGLVQNRTNLGSFPRVRRRAENSLISSRIEPLNPLHKRSQGRAGSPLPAWLGRRQGNEYQSTFEARRGLRALPAAHSAYSFGSWGGLRALPSQPRTIWASRLLLRLLHRHGF